MERPHGVYTLVGGLAERLPRLMSQLEPAVEGVILCESDVDVVDGHQAAWGFGLVGAGSALQKDITPWSGWHD